MTAIPMNRRTATIETALRLMPSNRVVVVNRELRSDGSVRSEAEFVLPERLAVVVASFVGALDVEIMAELNTDAVLDSMIAETRTALRELLLGSA